MIKVMISYDMQEGREKEAQEYLVNKLAPGLARLGFRVSDVLFTVWGDSPQITSAGELDDVETARTIFHSDEWRSLADGMDELTNNLNVRVMRSSN
jgi:hypothetical protein